MTDHVAPPDEAREALYVYFIDGYSGPVVTTEVRPGLMFDTTPDNRLVGIEVLDYERLTIAGYVTEDNCAHSQAVAYERARAAVQQRETALRAAAQALVDAVTPFGFPSGRALMYDSPEVERLRAALAATTPDEGGEEPAWDYPSSEFIEPLR